MEETTKPIKNKGGRPQKSIKKSCRLSVRCSIIQRKAIQGKAKSVHLTVSEYLLHMGLTGKIDSREKALPKDVLQSIGTMNHMAANLNQIAKKRNGFDPLDALDRAELMIRSRELKSITEDIKKYLL